MSKADINYQKECDRVRKEIFTQVEVMYREPGKAWKRHICKSQKALDNFIERINYKGWEVQRV